MNEREWALGARRDPQSVTPEWEPSDDGLIAGVTVRQVKNVVAADGIVTEFYRRDWCLEESEVEQVFQRTLVPGAVSAWHAHELTTDRLFVIRGLIQLALYDGRSESKTCGKLDVFNLAWSRPALVIIPTRVWHGVANLGGDEAALINIVDHAYAYSEPDHWRLPADSDRIPHRFAAVR